MRTYIRELLHIKNFSQSIKHSILYTPYVWYHKYGVYITSMIKNLFLQCGLLLLHSNNSYCLSLEEQLIQTCKEGNVEEAKNLLSKGAYVNTNEGQPLREASWYGYASLVKILIQAGADVHGLWGYPLHNAVGNGKLEATAELIQAGADIISKDKYPLRLATANARLNKDIDYTKLIKFLEFCYQPYVQKYIQQRLTSILGLLALFERIDLQHYLENQLHYCSTYIQELCYTKKYKRFSYKQTPLMWACMFNHTSDVDTLLASNLPPFYINAFDEHDYTALMYAAQRGNLTCIQKLRNHGAWIPIKTIIKAAESKQLNTLIQLLFMLMGKALF